MIVKNQFVHVYLIIQKNAFRILVTINYVLNYVNDLTTI